MESNNEPEFWTILKTPPMTQQQLIEEAWVEVMECLRKDRYLMKEYYCQEFALTDNNITNENR